MSATVAFDKVKVGDPGVVVLKKKPASASTARFIKKKKKGHLEKKREKRPIFLSQKVGPSCAMDLDLSSRRLLIDFGGGTRFNYTYSQIEMLF